MCLPIPSVSVLLLTDTNSMRKKIIKKWLPQFEWLAYQTLTSFNRICRPKPRSGLHHLRRCWRFRLQHSKWTFLVEAVKDRWAVKITAWLQPAKPHKDMFSLYPWGVRSATSWPEPVSLTEVKCVCVCVGVGRDGGGKGKRCRLLKKATNFEKVQSPFFAALFGRQYWRLLECCCFGVRYKNEARHLSPRLLLKACFLSLIKQKITTCSGLDSDVEGLTSTWVQNQLLNVQCQYIGKDIFQINKQQSFLWKDLVIIQVIQECFDWNIAIEIEYVI